MQCAKLKMGHRELDSIKCSDVNLSAIRSVATCRSRTIDKWNRLDFDRTPSVRRWYWIMRFVILSLAFPLHCTKDSCTKLPVYRAVADAGSGRERVRINENGTMYRCRHWIWINKFLSTKISTIDLFSLCCHWLLSPLSGCPFHRVCRVYLLAYPSYPSIYHFFSCTTFRRIRNTLFLHGAAVAPAPAAPAAATAASVCVCIARSFFLRFASS